jgi:anti-sigma B factor antagonist
MTDTRTAIELVEESSSTVRLLLRGDIDLQADDALALAYHDAISRGATAMTLDFTGVDYINSTGIALIVRLLAEARRDRRSVTAVGLSDHYRELFRITRLSDYMTIADDTQQSPEEMPR